MNELFFFFHIALVLGFLGVAFRLGAFAMMGFIALQAVFSNFFVVKEMDLFGFSVTCSDVFAVGGILGLNLLQEFFGKEAASKAIYLSFFALLFFYAMSKMHLLYVPSSFDRTHKAFETVFASNLRIVISSILVYFTVQRIDLHFFHWMKKRFSLCRNNVKNREFGKKGPEDFGSERETMAEWQGASENKNFEEDPTQTKTDSSSYFGINLFWVRLGISLFVSQLIDTVLFTLLALYGVVHSVWDVMVVSYLVKCMVILVSCLGVFGLKKLWGKDALPV